MTERIDVVSPWNDLAGRALRHAIDRRYDLAQRCVARLVTLHGSGCIPQVMVAWVDTAIAEAFPGGPPPPEEFDGMSFWREGDTEVTSVERVHPAAVWAGRFWVARLLDDEVQGRALVGSVASDRQWAEIVLAVLDVSASAIRLVRSGGTVTR